MRKSDAVASLGQRSLSLPAWIKAALAANDRLKLYLSVLQAAAEHAEHPHRPALDLTRDMAAAGLGQADDAWLHDLPAAATRADDAYLVPDLPRLAQRLADDLQTMARPVLEADNEPAEDARARVQHWCAFLAGQRDERLDPGQLHQLTHGNRQASDSLHILVMDLHKRLNRLAADLASEVVEGAHVWQLDAADRPRVAAFMRGVNRTAPLKFDHPGLDTAATRDGTRLLIQNDIGTNDAHVLVIQVEADTRPATLTLTYSDLHRSRFAFFQDLLGELGATWSVVEPRVSAGLNRGETYWVGTARFECADEARLQHTLRELGARIVFLIDWNRARKRLLPFVDKDGAIAVLTEAARREAGHMAWLRAGAERLIYDAMQALGEAAFRIGDRLDEVLGQAGARGFLVDALQIASRALLADRPAALVADEVRLLLGRQVRRHSEQIDLLAEHAAYCHALAQGVSDTLAQPHEPDPRAAAELTARAKAWERRADLVVMAARDKAERQPRWQRMTALLQVADDVADALEEAAFLLSLAADGHRLGWQAEVLHALGQLADAVLQATQDHVKAVAVVRSMGSPPTTAAAPGMAGGTDITDRDYDDFLAALWGVLRGERRCDALLREARRVILCHVKDAPSLMLANDLAGALELASDRLLTTGYALRDMVFGREGSSLTNPTGAAA